ncbi:MAG: GerMN domain-containing protein [Acidobacteria bacterium]|nr:GerMN domain-containing protein [Acidobacteriota bacterium]
MKKKRSSSVPDSSPVRGARREARKVLVGILLLAAIVLLFGFLYYQERSHQMELRRASESKMDVDSSVLQAQSSGLLKVQLYFYKSGSQPSEEGFLVPEERSVFKTGDVQLDARQVVNELLKGSNDHPRLFPEQAKLRQIYLLEEGTAVVDLSREASEQLAGGISAELAAIYSIVRSLSVNLSQVKRVKFIIEGREQPTFAGHVSLYEPFM